MRPWSLRAYLVTTATTPTKPVTKTWPMPEDHASRRIILKPINESVESRCEIRRAAWPKWPTTSDEKTHAWPAMPSIARQLQRATTFVLRRYLTKANEERLRTRRELAVEQARVVASTRHIEAVHSDVAESLTAPRRRCCRRRRLDDNFMGFKF
jgi:hypothetical protein